LPNPDVHEVIGEQIDLAPSKVFFGINLVREKMRLPKLEYPKRKLAVSPEQLMAIETLYEPYLPLPPIGIHKIIAKQLKLDEWRVHVAIGLIRKNRNLNRWNEDREDLPAEMREAQQKAKEEKEKLEKEKAEKQKAEQKAQAAEAKKAKQAKAEAAEAEAEAPEVATPEAEPVTDIEPVVAEEEEAEAVKPEKAVRAKKTASASGTAEEAGEEAAAKPRARTARATKEK
jgi:hypothetical protein